MLGLYRWQTSWTSKHAHASCTADIDTSLHVAQVQRMNQYCIICCETQNNTAATAVTGESQNKDAAVLHILCRALLTYHRYLSIQCARHVLCLIS